MERSQWNAPNGTLYVGVTSKLVKRIWEHREGIIDGFTKHYGLKRLVYAEHHDTIGQAIARETRLKHWPRAWKVRLIVAGMPGGLTSTLSSSERAAPDARGRPPRRRAMSSVRLGAGRRHGRPSAPRAL